LAPRWLSRVISVTLSGTKPAELRMTWRTNAAAKAALADELFGTRIIFTDRDERSIADAVAAYRSQSEIEADFRQMKDRLVVSFSPMFHWTEQTRPRLLLRPGPEGGPPHGPRDRTDQHLDERA
jgi:hypothetical protein